jgi:hypothetical protein
MLRLRERPFLGTAMSSSAFFTGCARSPKGAGGVHVGERRSRRPGTMMEPYGALMEVSKPPG